MKLQFEATSILYLENNLWNYFSGFGGIVKLGEIINLKIVGRNVNLTLILSSILYDY